MLYVLAGFGGMNTTIFHIFSCCVFQRGLAVQTPPPAQEEGCLEGPSHCSVAPALLPPPNPASPLVQGLLPRQAPSLDRRLAPLRSESIAFC